MDLSELKNYDYFDSLQYRYKMLREFPFISVFTIGKSVMGREISAFIIGEAEEYALFVGGVHGNCHFTSSFLTVFFKELCEAIKSDGVIEGLRVRKAISGRGLIVIPCLNPDGCEIAAKGKSALLNTDKFLSSRAKNNFSDFCFNARGVDLDRVFDINPKKECESAALYDFIKLNSIRHAILFDGGKKGLFAPENLKNQERGLRMSEIMIASTGYPISYGQTGFTRWFCEECERPSFTLSSPICNDSEYLKRYREIREFMMLTAIM